MSGINLNFDVVNQKGTPAFYSDIFANRPTYGYPGRVFISTDTGAIYEDTGSAWTLIADAGAGTTGTLQQVTTNGNTTTLGIQVQGIGINSGAGSGLNNVVYGSALTLNTTGNGITAIGSLSLNSNTTGNYNTALGKSSLESNNTANNNTAIGFASLQANTTGNNNTANGYASLTANTTASNNTTIGYNSGSNIITGSNNTIIGSYPGTSALTSNIVLSDGAGNVRLFSNATGLIGINQAVGIPSAQLDIHTTQTYGLAVNGTGTSNAYYGFANAGTYKWRIGNTYNAGANSLDFYNVGTSVTALSFDSTNSNAIFNGTITGSSLIKSGGTSVQFLKADGSIDSNTYLTTSSASSTYLALSGGTLTGALSGTSITGTSIIKSGGTSAQILAADGSVITAGTNITISGGTIASSGGGSMAIGGSITSATAGSVLFAGTSGVLAQNNASFFWDNTNTRLLIGTATTTDARIVAVGNASNHALFISSPVLYAGTYRVMRIYTNGNIVLDVSSSNGTDLSFNNQQTGFLSFSTTNAERFRITSGGNILVGTTTDSGQGVLQVSGGITGAGISLSGEVNTASATLSKAYYHVFTGSTGQTLTLPSPSSNNYNYVIINNTSNTVTVAAATSTNIITTTNTSVTSITLVANQRVLILADGNNKYYQIF